MLYLIVLKQIIFRIDKELSNDSEIHKNVDDSLEDLILAHDDLPPKERRGKKVCSSSDNSSSDDDERERKG